MSDFLYDKAFMALGSEVMSKHEKYLKQLHR